LKGVKAFLLVDGLQILKRLCARMWSETYGYDNYGNRWVSAWGAALPPSGETPTSSSWFDTNNRLAGVSYDAAGFQCRTATR